MLTRGDGMTNAAGDRICANCGKAIAADRERFCNHCGVRFAPDKPSANFMADTAALAKAVEAGTPILVRVYKADTPDKAAILFQADAARMARAGYYPVSQSWAQGQWGCGAFLIALLLAVLLIGILIFIYLLVVKPEGTLTVTYELRPGSTQSLASS